jgi:phosphatidylglycerol---prolipoprotein diacylglyceryl transferase
MLVHPQFDPVALHIGPLDVRWYGLMYLAGFVLFVVLGKIRARQNLLTGWHPRDVDDMLFYGVFGVILGGRLGYVLFYKPLYYLAHPVEVIALWQGGMSFHGGFLGVLLALALFAHNRHKRWLEVTDFVAPLCPLGLAAGRLGNFINGELWGRPTSLPWGMIFPQEARQRAAQHLPPIDLVPRHPSQLYELGLEGILLFAILWIYARRRRPTGSVSGLFLIGYGSFRFLVEYAREPDDFLGTLALGLSMGQWLSLPMIAAGIALFLWAYWKGRKSEPTLFGP